MDEGRSHVTERILSLTLEIIYLLTGEHYRPAKEKMVVTGRWNKKAPPSSLKAERYNDKKILEITKEIIELLMADLGLDKDAMMDNQKLRLSPGLLSGVSQFNISPSQDHGNEDLRDTSPSSCRSCSPAEKNMSHNPERRTLTMYERLEDHFQLSKPTSYTPERRTLTMYEGLDDQLSKPTSHTPDRRTLTTNEGLENHIQLSKPTSHVHNSSTPVKEERLSCGEGDLLQTDHATPEPYSLTSIKEEPSSCDEEPQPNCDPSPPGGLSMSVRCHQGCVRVSPWLCGVTRAACGSPHGFAMSPVLLFCFICTVTALITSFFVRHITRGTYWNLAFVEG